jgi:hypothetical protein
MWSPSFSSSAGFTEMRAVSDSPFSHLSTLRDDNVLRRLPFGIGYRPRVLDLGDHVHTLNHIPKYDVFAI